MRDMMDFSNPTVLGIWGATVVAAWLVAMAISYVVKGSGPPKVLPLSDFEEFPLIRKDVLSHDTARFTIGLPKGHVLGLPTGQHVTIQFKDTDGKAVQRSYTPTTDDTVVGEVSLVIKVYRPMPPKFPEGGKMSQYLDNLKIGDMIRMKGPKGHLTWIGKGGNFTYKPVGKPLQERKCKCVGMIAGGTGITPMLQVLNAIFTNPGDSKVKVKMIYANQTPDDILVREELEALAAQYPDRFQLWYTVDRVEGNNWKYSTGFISKDMVEQQLLFDDHRKNTQFFMCGPPPMIKYACLPNLQEFGYTDKDWVVF